MENQNKIQKDQALGRSTQPPQCAINFILSEQRMKISFLKIRRKQTGEKNLEMKVGKEF